MTRQQSSRPVNTSGGGRRSQRDDLLKSAMDLFAKEGSRGTPLSAIAERIGVTTPAITHHFGTKQALLMEVVQATDQVYGGLLDSAASSGIDRVSALRLWATLLATDSALAHLSRLRTVMVAEALDPDFSAHGHFVERHRRYRSNAAATVAEGQADGTIRPDVDPMVVATEIVAFMQGAQIQWFLDPDTIRLEEVFETYFNRLVCDLARLT